VNLDPDKYQEWEAKRRAHLESLKAEKLFPKLIKGDRSALASAITLIESTQNEHRKEANSLIKLPALFWERMANWHNWGSRGWKKHIH
jgi:hypothetical protein